MVDTTTLTAAAYAWEQDRDANGWDVPPTLTALVETPEGLAAFHLSSDLGPNERRYLTRCVDRLVNDRIPPPFTAEGRLVAYLMTVELWAVDKSLPQPPYATGPADVPGAYEVRAVIVATPNGDVIVVRRIRGQEPEVYGETNVTPDDLSEQEDSDIAQLAALLLTMSVTTADLVTETQ